MSLPKSAGEDEFVSRVQTFARATNIVNSSREIYRLRSVDEHLTSWPSTLDYVKEPQRDEFVARRTFQAELIAGFAYRTLLTDWRLRDLFRIDDRIEGFWSSNRAAWPLTIDLDASDNALQYSRT